MAVLSANAWLETRPARGLNPRDFAARLHMGNGRQFVVLLIALFLLTGVGCQKRQPQIPSQAKAPAEPIPTPLPPEITEETPPPPEPEPKPQPVKAEEPKPQPPKHRKKKPSQTTAQTGDTPAASSNSTVATAKPPANPANEAPADTAIAADVSSAQLLQQKQTTAQLVDATEKTLKGLPYSLSDNEKELVTQIRSYLSQSRKATSDGDFERAYNLATKAHLLSDALVKK